MTEKPRAISADRFVEALPHCKALSMKMESIGDGRAVISMPYDRALIGDPDTGVVHGGAVSALLDTCCGAAVYCHPRMASSTATLALNVDYMRSATPGKAITARAVCYHVARSIAFVRATADDGDQSRPVATATGAFTVG